MLVKKIINSVTIGFFMAFLLVVSIISQQGSNNPEIIAVALPQEILSEKGTEDPEVSIEENHVEKVGCAIESENPKYLFTDEEFELFVHLLYAEAGSPKMTDRTIRMVGEVVLNRIDSDKYPDTLKGVIYQQGQYGPATKGFETKEIPEDAMRIYGIAKDLIWNGQTILPDYVLGCASHEIAERNGTIYTHSQTEWFFIPK